MTTLGIAFRPQNPPESLREIARIADESGLEELWIWEDCFFQAGVSTTAAALAWTERVRIGVGVLPVPLRNVALAAMEIATLERMFPGRTIWGVGHGVQEWMGQAGARVESPVTLLSEYIDALRRLLAGERVSVRGRYVELDDVALEWPPVDTPPVLSAATGPRTLRLVGAVADGVVLTSGTTVEKLRGAVELVAEGRAAAGRADKPPVVVNLAVATGADAAERLDADLRAMGATDTAGLGVAGDAQAVADAIAKRVDAGADSVTLQPTADEPDLAGFVRFVAEKVRPLVP
ncbi:LLM class flavin-dependent oxidoreductase [Nocardia sp. CDC159]|uniref:LLM class flavin-dependent oxidoreductase n=1 Tax=Nocardia pulmonis TaxID=2951408 RepID=A0A9X2E620_9NOCA|nr:MULTISPECIES: LLM class flavin-dependent oxidoreductase [Nocardia]MCM6774767.1 LLM class flavin-dependent oxidoreductase [Nocardia pulmonis]MCM6789698.1 LLM class flavin-dependent oxidoreductase [Nocardia sp. CDC159]